LRNQEVAIQQPLSSRYNDTECFKIIVGSQEKAVASSRLKALLDQLYCDPKPASNNNPKLFSSSPAKFSYLAGLKTIGESDLNLDNKSHLDGEENGNTEDEMKMILAAHKNVKTQKKSKKVVR